MPALVGVISYPLSKGLLVVMLVLENETPSSVHKRGRYFESVYDLRSRLSERIVVCQMKGFVLENLKDELLLDLDRLLRNDLDSEQSLFPVSRSEKMMSIV